VSKDLQPIGADIQLGSNLGDRFELDLTGDFDIGRHGAKSFSGKSAGV
jgi:hypothetical protein